MSNLGVERKELGGGEVWYLFQKTPLYYVAMTASFVSINVGSLLARALHVPRVPAYIIYVGRSLSMHITLLSTKASRGRVLSRSRALKLDVGLST